MPNPYYKLFKASLRATRGINVDKDNSYDYKRYFNYSPADAMKLAAYNPNARFENPNNHFTDRYKTPIHPTFSNESIYSNSATPGGVWLDNQPVFVHSPYTAQHLDYTDDYLGYNVASGGPFEMSYYNGSYRIPTVEVIGRRRLESRGKRSR